MLTVQELLEIFTDKTLVPFPEETEVKFTLIEEDGKTKEIIFDGLSGQVDKELGFHVNIILRDKDKAPKLIIPTGGIET